MSILHIRSIPVYTNKEEVIIVFQVNVWIFFF